VDLLRPQTRDVFSPRMILEDDRRERLLKARSDTIQAQSEFVRQQQIWTRSVKMAGLSPETFPMPESALSDHLFMPEHWEDFFGKRRPQWNQEKWFKHLHELEGSPLFIGEISEKSLLIKGLQDFMYQLFPAMEKQTIFSIDPHIPFWSELARNVTAERFFIHDPSSRPQQQRMRFFAKQIAEMLEQMSMKEYVFFGEYSDILLLFNHFAKIFPPKAFESMCSHTTIYHMNVSPVWDFYPVKAIHGFLRLTRLPILVHRCSLSEYLHIPYWALAWALDDQGTVISSNSDDAPDGRIALGFPGIQYMQSFLLSDYRGKVYEDECPGCGKPFDSISIANFEDVRGIF
jgi:hypothetical protein